MNKHIEVVKKWLADNDSVSNEELTDNKAAAYTAAYAAADTEAEAAHAAKRAANAAAANAAAADAAASANWGDNKAAAHWVKRYEKLST